jgi:hypothetical protein
MPGIECCRDWCGLRIRLRHGLISVRDISWVGRGCRGLECSDCQVQAQHYKVHRVLLRKSHADGIRPVLALLGGESQVVVPVQLVSSHLLRAKPKSLDYPILRLLAEYWGKIRWIPPLLFIVHLSLVAKDSLDITGGDDISQHETLHARP